MGAFGQAGEAVAEQFTEFKQDAKEFVDELDAVELLKDLPDIIGGIKDGSSGEDGDGLALGDIWDGFKDYFKGDDTDPRVDGNNSQPDRGGHQRLGRIDYSREDGGLPGRSEDLAGDGRKSESKQDDDGGWESLIDDTLAGFQEGGFWGGLAGAAEDIWQDKEVREDVIEFGQDIIDVGEGIGDWFDDAADKVSDWWNDLF